MKVEMARDKHGNIVDKNIVYPQQFFPAEQQIECYDATKAPLLEELLEKERPINIYTEGMRPLKKFLQFWNKKRLQMALGDVLRTRLSGLYSCEDPLDVLDTHLTKWSSNYIWTAAEAYVATYGFASEAFHHFAKGLFHPLELALYSDNVSYNLFLGGNPEDTLNRGIALVIDRRWFPKHNVRRYLCAKKKSYDALEMDALRDYTQKLRRTEFLLHDNPLYHYMLHKISPKEIL